MTILGNHILSKLWASGLYRVVPFGGSNLENEAIEVYPAATLRRLGLRSYKRQPAAAIDAVLAFASEQDLEIKVERSVRAFCETYTSGGRSPDHDGADAFVALATAIFYREGLCQMVLPPDISPHTHKIEGAIWAPRVACP